jgi:small subunit ribosomal protein S10e
MFIPKENRIAVFSYLFKEGVVVVKKDVRSATHPHIEGPTNLEVLMLMKSLESRGFIRITFNWQYNYCYLKDEGIEYLREYLALPTTYSDHGISLTGEVVGGVVQAVGL